MQAFEKDKIKEIAQALTMKEWKIILQEAPLELIFYVLKVKVMKLNDTVSEYSRVADKVNRLYSDDDVERWSNEMPDV